MKALILAGGSGTRLWPVSRESKPKQFHSLKGNRTLLQMTFDRLTFIKPKDVFVSTCKKYEKIVRKQLPKVPRKNFIIEPESRDTGPAICFAAHHIAQTSDHKATDVMAVIYADHMIQRPKEFKSKLLTAVKMAKVHDTLNIVEVKAQFPNPNLGYVKIGEMVERMKDGTEVFELDHFVEKPSMETAKKYLASYKYLWNTGMYVWRVDTILSEFKKYAPEIYRLITKKRPDYAGCKKISIDYCLMEKLPRGRVWVIPADLGWSDIGTWSSLFDELTTHPHENYIQADHIGLDTSGSLIFGPKGKLIVTSGIKDLVIVDTPDALLVLPKKHAADVKQLVEEIKKRKKEKFI